MHNNRNAMVRQTTPTHKHTNRRSQATGASLTLLKNSSSASSKVGNCASWLPCSWCMSRGAKSTYTTSSCCPPSLTAPLPLAASAAALAAAAFLGCCPFLPPGAAMVMMPMGELVSRPVGGGSSSSSSSSGQPPVWCRCEGGQRTPSEHASQT